MKKDVIIASLVGFALGSISALLVVNLPSLLKRSSQSQVTTANITPTIASLSKTIPLLTIESPIDESIFPSKNIEISGKTTPGTILVLDADLENNVQVASNSGSFSFPTTLKEGANVIVVTAYNENGEGETKTLTVFYTSEKL